MCGIVGIIGKENATEVLLQGLQKLEYRGYDSAGIFVSDGAHNHLIKSQGRIKDLAEKITPVVTGTIGIGHTRWATHGVANEVNAHPHTSENQRFVLVHNGVIENYYQLKETYLQGQQFQGETDTEIVVHLIETLVNQGLTTKAAFKKALTVIAGSYAFALIDKEDCQTIYVAKNKSPLLIGLGDNFNVICSDAMAMLTETNQFLEINDGEMVIVTATAVSIENSEGQHLTREAFTAEIDLTDLEKGTYPYYMLKEIEEQPTVIRKIVQTYTNQQQEITIDEQLLQAMAEAERIYIIACGTSYNAGWVGKQLFETLSETPVEVHLASEFGYNLPLLAKKPFFIFLSQSGETADSRQVLVKINQLQHPALTITNVAGSTLSREAQYTLLLNAGPEIAVASTKAYTAQISVIALLTKALGEKKSIPEAYAFDILQELSIAANGMEAIITEKNLINQLVIEYLATTGNAFYIGRGCDYYVSLEAALKLKEISYIQAEGFAAGELKHGTIALIEEDTPVIALITNPITAPHTRGNLREVESRGAKTLVIATEELAMATDQIILASVHPLLSALVSVVPTQLIAYFATLQRGYDVDKPRNLAKSVTVE
ncbi:glucosamine--fructose-6-phosphate aminotransferase (isomerizing) [Enterococcus sp. PF1-24]|uniref:glutamine--fructose-6-phosphate transaminase (isomerizing) n=1 Tax=unclassified Enterococcus TaxID=2608891 RepID=UPI002475BDA4|nr:MULTISPECIES: glutamine--fructose-6-phosphate transaminase (isomerizing) [unclassified Enterococcus]MDH6363199.1 glucosamine--fructose-6-phosphate aminotransferase (isomerizing) [Enterococcus sp. PFB1-1]MDH6400293.1 glucosamine--fructose-6-phosphate aminotransferase (isomerizing) [Enterococcus sp. PF1-24]